MIKIDSAATSIHVVSPATPAKGGAVGAGYLKGKWVTVKQQRLADLPASMIKRLEGKTTERSGTERSLFANVIGRSGDSLPDRFMRVLDPSSAR